MKLNYQNGFFLFGVTVLGIMVSQLDFAEVWSGLRHAGYWFFAIVGLWGFLYLFNTGAWYAIINSQEGHRGNVGFGWLYKLTVSGFALNYATPGGLMGGEPYRIMELSPRIGAARASSSVILYAMTHIFSHFCFWLLSIALYLITRPIDLGMGLLLTAATLFCALGLWFFLSGYKHGLARRILNLMRHIPLVRRHATTFVERHKEQLDTIDRQIAALHRQNRRTFRLAVALEIACRVCSALEIYFVLLVLMPSADYIACILILAFTSLFANLLFFLPLQLGGREGGFLLSATGLGLTASTGIFVALIIRLRELVWTGIGLALIKIDRKKNIKNRQNCSYME